ncbi:uncharacterized protein LOC130743889 [Lotus japonicus]|uniref:uncharacterized protein LOC130743889 n=1 Tax=Lotus japonicus TaxID=34305 RepID=UPI00258FCE0F|nr:uncharacterized protein LOC130743889 [Lotus japonicus]
MSPMEDVLFWMGANDGVYNAKTGYLFLQQKLHQRAVDVDPGCPICRLKDESIDHLLMRCDVVKACWFDSRLGVRVDSQQRFPLFLQLLLRDLDDEGVAEVQSLLYAVWEARNRAVFDERRVDWREVLAHVASFRVPTVEEAQTMVASAATVRRWVRPARGIVKINVDAEVGRDKLAGYGMVERDNNGEIMASASMYPIMVLSPTIREALSLR